MAHHSVFPSSWARAGEEPDTATWPSVPTYFLILAIPCVLEDFTKPPTTFGDWGTLAAFGQTPYYLITIAAPCI